LGLKGEGTNGLRRGNTKKQLVGIQQSQRNKAKGGNFSEVGWAKEEKRVSGALRHKKKKKKAPRGYSRGLIGKGSAQAFETCWDNSFAELGEADKKGQARGVNIVKFKGNNEGKGGRRIRR